VRTIWKYELAWTDKPQPLLIPYMSMVLLGPYFAVQDGKLCIWAEVDTDAEPKEYVFHVRGTGHEVPPDVDYLGSTLTNEGRYVWHLFVSQDSL
jgi:hypothetical protein